MEYGVNERGDEVLVRRVCIAEGKSLSYQMHKQREEVWTVTAGHGEVILDNECRSVHVGDVIRIPQGIKHSILAHHELQMIETQIGSSLSEADIYRFEDPWKVDNQAQ
ncbi:Mannose-1-phosphate guanylyltransferase 1 [compost metagenome]